MDRWDLSPLYESFDSPEFINDLEVIKKYIEEINLIPCADISPEEKAEKYQYTLEYLSSWERLNPLPNKDHSFIPVLEKHIKELRCGQDG